MTGEFPVIVLGAGGHAKVVIDALQMTGTKILGAVDPDPTSHGSSVLGVSVLGGDDVVLGHAPDTVTLVNGVGSIQPASHRNDLYQKFKDAGYAFAPLIHPSAVVGGEVELAGGVQIMAGAVVQPGCRIDANTIINSRASLDHDSAVGAHVHIAPGAVICGGVIVGIDSFIGACATVIQYLSVGAGALVAAGAVVTSNVPSGARVAGVPAKVMK